jgi:hypothetical protein
MRSGGVESRSGVSANWPNGWGWSDPSAIPPPGMYSMQRSGVPVTIHTSLQIDSVFTACRVLTNSIIKMGNLRAYSKELDESNVPYHVWQPTAPPLLEKTWVDGTGSTMWQFDGMTRTIMSMALFGEAFWFIVLRDRMSNPSVLEVLHPAFIEVKKRKLADGTVQKYYLYGTGAHKTELSTDEVVHIPFMALPGAERGLNTIQYGGVAFSLALAAMEYGSRWFAQGASPSFLLTTDQKLGREEVERIADKFLIEHSGLGNSHLPLVVDSGMKVQKVSSTPDEAQYLGTLEYARMVIAAWFGLPSHLVGGTADKGNVWGKTVQEQALQLVDFALALDTPIPTPTGWTTMGDLKPGVEVFGTDGVATPVLSVSPVHINHDCFRVEFSDGTSIVADAGHRWETHTRRPVASKAINGDRWHGVYTTRELAESLYDYGDKRLNHRVAVAEPLILPDEDLLVDPYILGYWLGDGTSANASFTVSNEDLPDFLREVSTAGYQYSSPKHDKDSWRVYVSSSEVKVGNRYGDNLTKRLTTLGVLNNKHIPAEYFRGSIDQRLAILQGLMDSDGSISGGRCVFTNRNERLADGVLELARSLGLRPMKRTYQSVLNGVDCGEVYGVGFAPMPVVNAFRLQRKSRQYDARSKNGVKSSGYRNITAVIPVESVPVKCITVGTADHLYLAGESMIPTHNTLSGYIVRIEEAMSSLLPSGTYAAFNVASIQKANYTDQAAYITSLRTATVMTPNEVRTTILEMAPSSDPAGDQLAAPLASNAAPAGAGPGQAAAQEDSQGSNPSGN